jgi:hypothetical protein
MMMEQQSISVSRMERLVYFELKTENSRQLANAESPLGVLSKMLNQQKTGDN